MLSTKSFYIDDNGHPYIIEKMTDKTVLFSPVKSEYIGHGDISSAFLFDTVHKATLEPDKTRKSIRFRLCNNFSTRGLANFSETKNGTIKGMYEIEGDTFSVEHNYG